LGYVGKLNRQRIVMDTGTYPRGSTWRGFLGGERSPMHYGPFSTG